MSGQDRRKPFARAGWLLAGLWLALAPAAMALEAVKDGGFDLPPSTSPWQSSGPTSIVGGVAELQDGASLFQVLDDAAKLPGQGAGLYFDHNVQGTYLEVSLDTEINTVPNQLVLQIFPGDPSPFFYPFTGGEIIPLGATLRFTFAGSAYQTAWVDNVSLEITTIVIGPTGTPVATGTPLVPTHTPVATPTGPTPTPSPTATTTASPSPEMTATPTPPPPTPTPNQKAVRLQLSANPNFLQGRREELPQLRSVIRMSVLNVNGTVLTNTGSGGFYANVTGPGTLGGVSPSLAFPGVFEADFIPFGEGRCVVEVLYSGGLLPQGADPLTNSVAISVDVTEKRGVAPGPPSKKTLYQREK